MSEADDRADAAHAAALGVLREADANGTPFVLYLRKFDIKVLHGATEGARKYVEQELMAELPAGTRVLSVQENPDGEMVRTLFDPLVPALRLGGADEWQARLHPILVRADLIVSEFQFLSGGVEWEIDSLVSLGKRHQTVLVLPPQDSPIACIDHRVPLDRFPRVVWADQLFTEKLADTFVIKDLIARMDTIANLPVEERRAAYAAGRMTTRVPVSYAGVKEGYVARAAAWEAQMAASPDPALAYYRFWDHFRASAVLGALMTDLGALTLEHAVRDLAYLYTELLRGIANRVVSLDQPDSFLTTDFMLKLAGSVRSLIRKLPQDDEALKIAGVAMAAFQQLGLPVTGPLERPHQ
jgi:hypothetical protein